MFLFKLIVSLLFLFRSCVRAANSSARHISRTSCRGREGGVEADVDEGDGMAELYVGGRYIPRETSRRDLHRAAAATPMFLLKHR